MIKVYARERYFTRLDSLKPKTIKAIKAHYTHHFFEERGCSKCEWKHIRDKQGVMGECESCAAYKGSTILASNVVIKDTKYLATPLGDGKGLYKILKTQDPEVKLISKHQVHKIKPIKFTGTLRDYQEQAVNQCIEGKKGVLYSPPRSGKCIVGSSMVMTSKGLLPIQSLFNDYSLPHDQEFEQLVDLPIATVGGTRQVASLYSKVVDETIRIRTKNGYTIKGTPNHKVLVLDENLKQVWVRLDQVTTGDYLVLSRKKQWLPEGTPSIKTDIPYDPHEVIVPLPNKLTIELAELLGFLVANGSLSIYGRLGISSYNVDVQNRFIECLCRCFPGIGYTQSKVGVRCHNKYVYRYLKDCVGLKMGTSKSKSIPEILFKSDKKFIDAYLKAYMSCDTWVSGTVIQFCTASKTMASQLHILLSYYGCPARLSMKISRATNGACIYRKYYHVTIRGANCFGLYDSVFPLYKECDYYKASKNQIDVLPYAGIFLNRIHDKHVFNLPGKGKPRRYLSDDKAVYPLQLHYVYKNKGRFKHRDIQYQNAYHVNTKLLKTLDKDAYKRWTSALNPDVFYEKITSVRLSNKPVRVYDVFVPERNHFIANGIVNHNTVMLSALVTRLQVKTLLIASQREWLLGFQETFIGSNTQKPLTDLDKSRIGFCKKFEDFEKYDVCLATVQTFHSAGGQKLLRKIRDMFTLVGIDEVHTSSAYRYIQEVSRFNCKYKIGLTGTPDRKDGKYVLTEQVVGPVLYQAKVESWRPTVKLTRTKYNKVMKSGVWAYMVGNLENDKARQKLIAEQAIKDMEAGHMVLIPYTRVKAIQKQVQVINELYGSEVAYPFYGGLKKDVRDSTIQKAREYKVKIIVGNMRLLSTGTNIPRASALYEVTMSSNLPMGQQRFARVLTPYDGKPQPIIRYFLDDTSIRKSCMSNEFWNCLMKKFRPIISDKDMEILKAYFSQRSSRRDDIYVSM